MFVYHRESGGGTFIWHIMICVSVRISEHLMFVYHRCAYIVSTE